MRLLLVEDEEIMQRILKKGFEKLGYMTDVAYDGEVALDLFYGNVYDLVVLDLNLPKLSGMEVLLEIRRDNFEIPVLILSARDEVETKIQGLDGGANDYLVKPFHFSELEARVRALLRRRFKVMQSVIELNGVTIDTGRKKVYSSAGEIVLSRIEYRILEYLARHRGESIAASTLIERTWESVTDSSFNSFKVRLSSLRKKLPEDLIKTVRGHGYYVE